MQATRIRPDIQFDLGDSIAAQLRRPSGVGGNEAAVVAVNALIGG